MYVSQSDAFYKDVFIFSKEAAVGWRLRVGAAAAAVVKERLTTISSCFTPNGLLVFG